MNNDNIEPQQRISELIINDNTPDQTPNIIPSELLNTILASIFNNNDVVSVNTDVRNAIINETFNNFARYRMQYTKNQLCRYFKNNYNVDIHFIMSDYISTDIDIYNINTYINGYINSKNKAEISGFLTSTIIYNIYWYMSANNIYQDISTILYKILYDAIDASMDDIIVLFNIICQYNKQYLQIK